MTEGVARPAPRIDWLSLGAEGREWTAYKGMAGFEAHAFRLGGKDLRSPWSEGWRDGTGAVLEVDLESARMSWRVTLPGRACAVRHLDVLMSLPGNVQRMDLAVDVTGVCTNEWLMEKLDGGFCVSRWRQIGDVNIRKLADLEDRDKARTLYIGKRGLETMLRVYNRSAKLGLDGERVTRYELELRGHAAEVVRGKLRDGWSVLKAFKRLLHAKFRVCDKPVVDRTHSWRAELDPDWARLWETDEGLSTTRPDGDPAEKFRRRVRAARGAARTLATMVDLLGVEAVERMLQDGRSRARAADAALAGSEDARAVAREELDRMELASEDTVRAEVRAAERRKAERPGGSDGC